MKSPFYFIVEPVEGKRYNNTKTISGLNFITSTSEEDYTVSNRKGIVKEVPLKYQGPIQKGDILLVHHNVFKYYNDMKGSLFAIGTTLSVNIFFASDPVFDSMPTLESLTKVPVFTHSDEPINENPDRLIFK